MKILHITPHCGGGVGTVLSGYLNHHNTCKYKHVVACMDFTESKSAIDKFPNDVSVFDGMMHNDPNRLRKLIEDSDTIIMHWWNHPMLYKFMVANRWPPCRIAAWAHSSGLHPTSIISQKLLDYVDVFVPTNSISNSVIHSENRTPIYPIWSTGGIKSVKRHVLPPRNEILVGYLGTVSYSKMHREFVNMCKNAVAINNRLRFVVCGGPDHERLRQEASTTPEINVLGPTLETDKFLSQIDIFGYPLARHHFGTCEQVLGEAMSFGIPAVVLDNQAEQSIVRDGIDGIVAKNPLEYSRALAKLASDANLINYLGNHSKQRARDLYSLDTMVNLWDALLEKMLCSEKKPRSWNPQSSQGHDLFIQSIGKHADVFLRYLQEPVEHSLQEIRDLFASSEAWMGEHKGTVRCYAKYYPNDRHLRVWQTCALKQ